MLETDATARALLQMAYERFNARDVDAVLALMTGDVDWPNGWEGGYVHGHDEVRDYWTRQWAAIDGNVTPQEFSTRPDGQIDATVHQVVKNLKGELLEDCIVHHVYRLRGDRIARMEIRR